MSKRCAIGRWAGCATRWRRSRRSSPRIRATCWPRAWRSISISTWGRARRCWLRRPASCPSGPGAGRAMASCWGAMHSASRKPARRTPRSGRAGTPSRSIRATSGPPTPVAHVCEMSNRVADGIAWIDGLAHAPCMDRQLISSSMCAGIAAFFCSSSAAMTRHSSGTIARCARNRRRATRYLERGVPCCGGWSSLASRSAIVGRACGAVAQAHRDDHLLVFADIHYVMALTAMGDGAALDAWRASARAFAAQSPEDEAEILRAIGLPLAEAADRPPAGERAAASSRPLLPRPGLHRRQDRRQPCPARRLRRAFYDGGGCKAAVPTS